MSDNARLEELDMQECLSLLRQEQVGRVAVVVDEFPIVLPVNYKVVQFATRVWIALRTRPGNVLDRASTPAAFEIDSVEPARRQGWSVLVRGMLQHVDPDAADFRERFDPAPWIEAERDAWLVIEPFAITGRRLNATQSEWAFHMRAYL
jgi:nitroimidazol reductase NimA-like FMN-containing flavoprotein (pyridoxamine 5'-phosphate oxidase superfamily)